MLATVYLKSVRDRWFAAAIAVASLFAIAWVGMWSYAGIGDDLDAFLAGMPDAYLSLLGISADAGPAAMMLSNLFNFMGPFIIAGIGISIAAAAIAGEESAGTMNVLGTMPRSRSRLLRSKTLALVTIVVGSGVIASLSYLLAGRMAGEDLTSMDLTAATVHMLVVALLFAAVALVLGAWTGNRGLASGVAVGLIVVSFLVSGLLPLFDGLADWAQISPWYWIAGPQPLVNGIDWPPLLVILGVTLVLGALTFWGLDRRDLGAGVSRTPLLERLREDPRIGRAVSMLAGSGSTRGIASKSLSDMRPVMIIAAGFLAFQAIVLGPLFTAISTDLGDFVNALPDSILAMVGFADFSTPEGWYFGEVMSIVAPVAVAVVAINAGSALVREEKNRTVNVLLALPLSRASVATRKAVAIVTGSLVVGAALSLGIAAGNAIGGLGMSYANIGAAGLMLAGLGVLLGAVAFLAGGLTGRSSVAVGAGTGVAIVGWGINSFVPVNPDVAHWARVSPFYYYAEPNPLIEGVTWWHLGVLVGVAAVLVAIGVAAYRGRDLRG